MMVGGKDRVFAPIPPEAQHFQLPLIAKQFALNPFFTLFLRPLFRILAIPPWRLPATSLPFFWDWRPPKLNDGFDVCISSRIGPSLRPLPVFFKFHLDLQAKVVI